MRVRWGRVGGLALGVFCIGLGAELIGAREALHAGAREGAALAAELERVRGELALGRARERASSEALAALRGQYAEARARLRDVEQLAALDAAQPVTRATVIAVDARPDMTLILLSARAPHGVVVGVQFTVYREDRFVAKLTVEQVSGDVAVCRVLFHAVGLQVRPGDRAVTRLS